MWQYDMYVEAVKAKMGDGKGSKADSNPGNIGAQQRRQANRG